MGEAGRRNDGRRVKAFFSLTFAPFRMAAHGLWIWAAAEADYLRLRLKRLLLGKPVQPVPSYPLPEEAGSADRHRI